MRPICWTKNSPLPAAHLLCESTCAIRPAVEEIDEERFASERHHGVEDPREFGQRALNRRGLGKVAALAAYTERFRVAEFLPAEQPVQHLQGPALMRRDAGRPLVAAQGNDLHRQRTNVHPDARHGFDHRSVSCRYPRTRRDTTTIGLRVRAR